jgi:hypothetical protein
MYDAPQQKQRVIEKRPYGIRFSALARRRAKTMRFRYRGCKVLSALIDEPHIWVPAGLDHPELSCSARLDAENDLGHAITRAEIMEYLGQTYGSMFVEDLAKHLP